MIDDPNSLFIVRSLVFQWTTATQYSQSTRLVGEADANFNGTLI